MTKGATKGAKSTRPLLVLLVAAFLSLMTKTGAASDESASLQAAFLKGEYGSVVDRTKVLLESPRASAVDELLYLQGVSALKTRELDLAEQSLRRLTGEFPESRWKIQGGIALGDVLQAKGRQAEALVLYQDLRADARGKPMAAQILFRMGQAQRRLEQWEQAKLTYQAILSEAPQSAEAAWAKELLATQDFAFSIQVGAFRRKANASRLTEELARRGYSADLTETILQGRRFYRVRVGQFASRQEAVEMWQRLREEGFPGKVVP